MFIHLLTIKTLYLLTLYKETSLKYTKYYDVSYKNLTKTKFCSLYELLLVGIVICVCCIFFVWFLYRSPIIFRSFSVWFSFCSRSVLDWFSFGSRSVLDRFSFILRSSFVHPSFILRSFSVRQSKNEQRTIEDRSKKYRIIIGGKTEMYRNSNGKPRERQHEQKLYF